jgi:menaquinone-9 beta-reductase
MTHDVAIIGAGPAGTSAAITLARTGARVLLLERGRFPRHKVCGEFVSAESLSLLHSLLGNSAFDDPTVLVGRTRLFIDGRVITATIAPAAASITRFDLDHALWNAAQKSGAHCRDNCDVSDIIFDGDNFRLHTGAEVLMTAAVLDGTGRWSRLRDDKIPSGPKWIGLKCHFRETAVRSANLQRGGDRNDHNAECPSVDLYFFDNGYCGVQPIAPGVVNACAMVRSDRATTLEQVFTLSSPLRHRSQHWTPLFSAISTAPLIFRDPQPLRMAARTTAAELGVPETGFGTPILCIGDAAAFVDPFVGDGISLAIRTGVAAAESLKPYLRGEESVAQGGWRYQSIYEQEFLPILKAAARVRTVIEKPRPLFRAAALSAMRLPWIANYVIRKTRTAN